MAETENVPRGRQEVTLETAMKTYTGIDYHKRYSVACTVDAQGNKLQEAKIEANAPEPKRKTLCRAEPNDHSTHAWRRQSKKPQNTLAPAGWPRVRNLSRAGVWREYASRAA